MRRSIAAVPTVLFLLLTLSMQACRLPPQDPVRRAEWSAEQGDLLHSLGLLDRIGPAEPHYAEARNLAAALERRMRTSHQMILRGLELRAVDRDREAIASFEQALAVWPRMKDAEQLIRATRDRMSITTRGADEEPDPALLAGAQRPDPAPMTEGRPGAAARAARREARAGFEPPAGSGVEPGSGKHVETESRAGDGRAAVPAFEPPAASLPPEPGEVPPAAPEPAPEPELEPESEPERREGGAERNGVPTAVGVDLEPTDARTDARTDAATDAPTDAQTDASGPSLSSESIQRRRGKLELVQRHLERGDMGRAMDRLAGLRAEFPEDRQVAKMLARVLHQRALLSYGQGRLAAAIDDWEWVVRLEDDSPQAKAFLRAARTELARRGSR